MSIRAKFEYALRSKLYILLSFFIPAAIFGGIYIYLGVFPFGSRSVLTSDLFTQYIDFYAALRRIVFSGASPFYSWSKALGDNMMGIVSYYLASPFSILTLLFPEKYLIESIVAMTLAKVGCSGLAMYVYLSKSRDASGPEALIFSIPYALMSFVVTYSFNLMWLDGIILLPLIALGIDRIVKGGRVTVYYAALTVMLIANYYIGYMLCIFSVLYFLYKMALQFSGNDYRTVLQRFVTFVSSSILSGGSAAFLLLPTYSLLSGRRLGVDRSFFTFIPNFNPLDLLPKLLFGSYDTAIGGLPNIYCGLAVLLLVMIFFAGSHVSLRKKIISAAFLALILIGFYWNSLDLVWHGFQRPTGFLFRNAFLFSFLMMDLAYLPLKELMQLPRRTLIGGLAIALAIVAFVMVRGSDFLSLPMLMVSFALLCGYFAILYFGKQPKRVALLLFGGIVTLEALFNASIFMFKTDQVFIYKDRVAFSRFTEQMLMVLDKINSMDSGFYRIEKTFILSDNDDLGLGYKGVSHFSSLFNQTTFSFLQQFGFLQGSLRVEYRGETIPGDSLLGIKYILEQKPNLNGYPEIASLATKIGDIHIYKNPYALPLGFLVDNGFASIDGTGLDPIKLQDKVLGSMLGKTSASYFSPAQLDRVMLHNVSSIASTESVRYKITNPEEDGTIEYIFQASNADPVYSYLTTSTDQYNKIEVSVNGNSLGFFGENTEFNNILLLGSFVAGQEISFKLRMLTDNLVLSERPQIYHLNQELFIQTYQDLAFHPLSITRYSDTSIQGKVSASEGRRLLFTSIPYDEGWAVKVDGKPVEKTKLLNTFIGVILPVGDHQIQFSYVPPGFSAGCVISLVALLLAVSLIIRSRVVSAGQPARGFLGR
jgi:uncharacterized membrane protein YfhO